MAFLSSSMAWRPRLPRARGATRSIAQNCDRSAVHKLLRPRLNKRWSGQCCQGVIPNNLVWLRIATAAVRCGRDRLVTDVLPGSTPQQLRVRTGCTPQSSSTLQQAVASSQTRLQGPCHHRGQDQPKIGDMHGQSQPLAKPCFGLALECHIARVQTHQCCQLPRFELPSC